MSVDLFIIVPNFNQNVHQLVNCENTVEYPFILCKEMKRRLCVCVCGVDKGRGNGVRGQDRVNRWVHLPTYTHFPVLFMLPFLQVEFMHHVYCLSLKDLLFSIFCTASLLAMNSPFGFTCKCTHVNFFVFKQLY